MQCSQCQTELPDSVTTCPRCGASNQESQPVTFSYLPAGTPPWPTAVPQRLLTAEPLAPASVVSQNQPAKPRRSLRNVLLAVTVLVLVPILGAAFTLANLYFSGDLSPKHAVAHKTVPSQTQSTPVTQQTPGTTQGNQLPAPTSFSTASDKDLNLSLQYPSDWQKIPVDKSGSTVSAGFQPTQKLGIILVVERFLDTTQIQSPSSLNRDTINSVGSQIGATNAQPVASANTQPTISGTRWTEMDVVFSDTNGSQDYFASISVLHNKSYYNIVFLLPSTVHDEAMQKYIQPMLNSVQFLS
jgi:hypothetical protein